MIAKKNKAPFVCACFTLLLVSVPAAFSAGDASEDWPQFRGVSRDGIAHSSGLRNQWPEEGPNVLWRVPLGEGFSGVAVSDNRLYTLYAEGETEYAACFDPANGKLLWRHPIGEKFVDEFGNGPRSTPTVDEKLVYFLGAKGKLLALDKKTGETSWSLGLTESLRGRVPRWGYSSSPLVEGDMLLLEPGGEQENALAALDKNNGKTLWTSSEGETGYTSPLAVTFNGVRQFLFISSRGLTAQNLVAVDAEGKQLWEKPLPGFIVAMPIFIPPDKIFVSASNDDGCALLRMVAGPDSIQIEEVWSNRVMRNIFNSCVYHEGYLYGFNNATLRCVDVASGEFRWAKRGFGKGSLIIADGRLIVLSDRGKLAMAEASPESYKEIASFQALRGKAWTSPTLAGGRLYLRDQKEMVCFDLKD